MALLVLCLVTPEIYLNLILKSMEFHLIRLNKINDVWDIGYSNIVTIKLNGMKKRNLIYYPIYMYIQEPPPY